MAKSMRKVRVGSVVRTGMEKTAVVETVWKQRHRLYRKQMRRVARYRVHDPLNQCQVGDLVRIEETRPISKTKHWRILEIIQSRQVAEVRPMDLEADAEITAAGTEAMLEDTGHGVAVAALSDEEGQEADVPEDEPVPERPTSDESVPNESVPDGSMEEDDSVGEEDGEKEAQE